MIDKNIVKRGLAEGLTKRQIARQHGWSRTEVESVAKELKVQNARRRNRITIIIGVVLLTVVAGGYGIFHLVREPSRAEMSASLLRAVAGMRVSGNPQPWVLENLAFDTPLAAYLDFTRRMTRQLGQILADNTAIPEVKELAQIFAGHLYPTIFNASVGTSMTIGKGDAKEAFPQMRDPHGLEVVFYEHAALRHPRMYEQLLFYAKDWRALMMAALNFGDEKWLAAFFVHELWHAKKHREGAASATAPRLSDLWTEEELEAHEVERKLLNFQTGGRYDAALRAIVSEVGGKSVVRFFTKLSPRHIQKLDGLFLPGVRDELTPRSGQYIMDLMDEWSREHWQGPELKAKKIEAYRMLFTSVGR